MSAHHTYTIKAIMDYIDVPMAFIASLTILSLEKYMGLLALTLTVSYTIWKWSTEIYDRYFKNKKLKVRK